MMQRILQEERAGPGDGRSALTIRDVLLHLPAAIRDWAYEVPRHGLGKATEGYRFRLDSFLPWVKRLIYQYLPE